MEERLNQMSAVLQAMQKTLECNICLDLMNKPLTTKCGHSFCADCIHQVVKGPRSSAQCPLCMTNITRRSLGHNNKITNLVVSVRKIIDSIKRDCCFEVTPSKYRARPRPVINPEDDDSENEENDEPRRGTRKRGVTSHYNPEVHIPKPRVKSAKQRILATDNGQELSLHTEVKPEKFVKDEEGIAKQDPVAIDVISKEHSYSSPTKQEPVVRTSLIPTIGRGRGSRGGGAALRGKGKVTATGAKGKALGGLVTYNAKKEDLEKSMLSVSQREKVTFPGEAMASVQENSDHLSEKLGRVDTVDKVANWLTTSSEVGFRIGVTQSTDAMSTDSEEVNMKAKGKEQPKSGLVAPKVIAAKRGSKKFVYPNDSLSLEPASSSSSSFGIKKFFKATLDETTTLETESRLPTLVGQETLPMPSQDDPFNFIPSQKTPKQLPTTTKRDERAKPRARGMLKLGRGRVRGRGRGRGLINSNDPLVIPEGFLDETRLSTANITLHKQSTPLGKGNKMKEDINLSLIKPPDVVVNFANNEPMPSVIVQTHADIEDDHGIPDSCPVSTKNEFDVLVSEVKGNGKVLPKEEESKQPGPETDAEANLLFVTPAQGPDKPSDIVEKEPEPPKCVNQTAKKEKPKSENKRANDDGDIRSEPSKRPRVKKSSTSGSDSEGSHGAKRSKSKAEKAKEEVEALCSMFEEIEDHSLKTVSLVAAEKERKQQEIEKEESMRLNITDVDKTLENTKLNRSALSTAEDVNSMPPPKGPVKNKKVKFQASLADEDNVASTSKENLTSMATRSTGKKTTSKIPHNVRYASEIKLVEPSKKVAMSVNVKDSKSPGWSHVAGARKDLKTRHTSLKIIGGEQRNINDSRTEGGTSVLSSKVASSSEESEVNIDDQTQDFDVEHLCQSQTKNERVKKLKEIVSQLKTTDDNEISEETKSTINPEENHIKFDIDNAAKDRENNCIKGKSQTRDNSKAKETTVEAVSRNSILLKDQFTSKQNKLAIREIESDTSIANGSTSAYEMTQVLNAEGEPLESKIITPSETEPFECDLEPKRKSSVSSRGSSSSDSSCNLSTRIGKRVRQPAKAGPKETTSRLPRTSRQPAAGSSKLSRKTFSLNANTQDLSSLQTGTQSSVNIPENSQSGASSNGVKSSASSGKETGDIMQGNKENPSSLESPAVSKPLPVLNAVSSTSEEKSLTLSSKQAVDKRENRASTSSDSSAVTLPPHHTISTSAATQSLENNKKDILPTSGASSSGVTHSNLPDSDESKVVPFRSIGPLCSKRCAEAGESGVTLAGTSSRDLCLHAIPCEVYQVLMKYMTLLVTQQDTHSTCCGSSHLTKLLDSKGVQTSPASNTNEEDNPSDCKRTKISDHPLSELDSQLIPCSFETQEMESAIPLPNTRGVKTRARKEKDAIETNRRQEDLAKENARCDPSEIMPVKDGLLTHERKYDSNSLSQNSDTQTSEMSTSLLADISEAKQGRTTRSTNPSGDVNSQSLEGRSGEKGDRAQLPNQKVKEKAGAAKTGTNKNNLVEVEKENLKNQNTLPVPISRPRRKPLQSGQPVIENIMSQLSKEEKKQTVDKMELSQIQNQDSQSIQKSLSTQNRPASSKPLFASDESSHGSKKPKDGLVIGPVLVEEDQQDSDSDSPLKSSIDPKRQNFKRIRRPSSGSSSEESDSESVVQPRKRKAKSISSSDSTRASGGAKDGKLKTEELEQHKLDSEEMRDLERFDKNVWEFFGHPDEDLLANDDDKSSHVTIEDPSQNKKRLCELEDDPLVPSIPSDEDIPNTEDVLRNVQSDLNLIKKIRENNTEEPEVISLVSQDLHPTTISTQKPTFSASTKLLFSKADKNLVKAEDLLCSGKSFFSGPPSQTSLPKRNSVKSTNGEAKSRSDKQTPGLVSESDHDTEEDTENMSHSSAYSSQSEAISTQKREEVKDEVEMLKARVRELEAVVKKKETEETGLRDENQEDDALPPTCPTETEFSDAESEELFSSLPDLTKSTEPKLPISSLEKKKTKVAMSGPPSLVCTGLNSSEMSKVQELVNKLAPPGTKLLKTWTEGITHVVVKTDEDRMAQRTLKYLYGVANGCWIVMLDWVLESLTLQELQNEEEYEVLDCTGVPGPHRARTTITPLFHGCEFYLVPPFMDVSLEQLVEMMEKCGARVVDSPQKFSQNKQSLKLIVLQTDGEHEATGFWKKQKKVCVAHDWIIECIGMYARICISPYISGSPTQTHLTASCLPLALLQETQEL